MESLEKRILTELKYGNKTAFEYVFKTYFEQLYRYAQEILKDSSQAEDVVADLFVRIWEDRKKINVHTSVRSYLFRSTYNASLNVLRKKRSENKYRDFFLHHADFVKSHNYGSSSYPLSDIIEKEYNEKIEKVIDDLPPQCRRIFLMSRVEDLPHKEIAERLGISVNTVKSQIMNGLKKLQATIKDIIVTLLIISGTFF
jgi:RNA polymerase sigma-70 factor, ECF subfamily